MPNLLIIDPQDTPNIGRYKINYNFSILVFSSFTGIAASIFTNPNPTTVTVGGIPAGTTFPTDQYLQGMMDLLLYPAVTPNFTSFLISAQATTLEVGAAVTGSKTFTWTIANTADLLANSIDIEDTTNATTLATGLADDGTETVFLSSVTKTVPDYNVWTISAQDTDTTVFTRTYTIEWRYAVFYGISASLTLNAAAIVALTGTSLVTDVSGSYSLAGSGYGYLCVPTSFSVPNGFRDSVTNLPIEMAGTSDGYTSFDGAFFYDSVSVTRNGIPITYRVYRTKYSITTTTMNVAVTGGTAVTLQSAISAGNIATGNAAILGNFSATTYFSGTTPLSTILSNYFAGTNTYVQPGLNITTGGTPNAPIINVIASPLFTSVSATTFYSAGTDLNFLLNSSGSTTYVQPGLNTTTGGTPTNPIINTLGSPTFTAITASSVFATNFSGATLYSGNTLLQNALTLQTVVNAGNTAERSIYLQGDGSSGTLLRKVIFRDTDLGYSGTSDPSIGIDYNIIGDGAQLLLESPDTIYQITKAPISPATTYPSLAPSFYLGEDTGTAPPIWMGFLSANTGVNRVYNYLRISEKDVSNGYGGEVLLTATGTSTASYGQYIANFPAKSGTVAMLDDIISVTSSTSVQSVNAGINAYTGGTPSNPIVGVVGNPVFTAVTATTYFSGTARIQDVLTLEVVTTAGNTAERNIVLQGSGTTFDLVRQVVFKELDPALSGASDASIGINFPLTSSSFLTLESPGTIFHYSKIGIQNSSLYPGVISSHHSFREITNYAPVIDIGFMSAVTNVERTFSYLSLGEKDITNNYGGGVLLTATGTSALANSYYIANLPAKSGTLAMLDDVGASTYVQPGTNITTGGTVFAPIVSLAGSIVLTGVTANIISGTSISATTYYSGDTPLQDLIFTQSLQQVTDVGNTTDNDIVLFGDGDLGDLTRKLTFKNTGAAFSGSSDASIGIDIASYFNSGLVLDSPEGIKNLSRLPVQNLGSLYPNSHFVLSSPLADTGYIGMGFASATTDVNAYHSYLYLRGINPVVGSSSLNVIIATGNTALIDNVYYANLPGKSGTIAMLDDIGASTYVQPGTNIVTGGTVSAPVVSVVASPLFVNLSATTLQEQTYTTPGGVYYRGPDGNLVASSDLAFDEDLVILTVAGSISAATVFEGSQTLSAKYAPLSVVNRYVQPGTNITTGGTEIAPTINLIASPSVTNLIASGVNYGATVSGATIYEGSSLLSEKYAPKNLTTTLNSGTYILQLTDNSNLVDLSGGSAQNLVVPRNSSIAFPIGAQVMVAQTGAGQVTFSADTGVSILSYLSMTKIIGQYGVASLVKKDSNVWILGGALTA